MTILAIGPASLAVLLPGAAAANTQLLAACAIAAPNADAQAAAMATAQPQVNLSLPDMLGIANQIVANIQLALAAGLTAPNLQAQVDMHGTVTASINANIAAIQLALAASIAGPLEVAGVEAYVFDGSRASFGSELAAELGSAGGSTKAIVLMATTPAAWAAIQAIFKTS